MRNSYSPPGTNTYVTPLFYHEGIWNSAHQSRDSNPIPSNATEHLSITGTRIRSSNESTQTNNRNRRFRPPAFPEEGEVDAWCPDTSNRSNDDSSIVARSTTRTTTTTTTEENSNHSLQNDMASSSTDILR